MKKWNQLNLLYLNIRKHKNYEEMYTEVGITHHKVNMGDGSIYAISFKMSKSVRVDTTKLPKKHDMLRKLKFGG